MLIQGPGRGAEEQEYIIRVLNRVGISIGWAWTVMRIGQVGTGQDWTG
jgi:hypothetical protein